MLKESGGRGPGPWASAAAWHRAGPAWLEPEHRGGETATIPRLENIAWRQAAGGRCPRWVPHPTPKHPRSLSAALPVDVLRTLGLRDGQPGVTVTAGICPQRPGADQPDFAFRLDNRTRLDAPTRQLFPGTPPTPRQGAERGAAVPSGAALLFLLFP